LLGEIVVRLLLARAEAFVAPLHRRDDLLRGHLVALRPGEGSGMGEAAVAAPDRRDGRHRHRRLEKGAAVAVAGIRLPEPVIHNHSSFREREPITARLISAPGFALRLRD
jgi:hypothetical protein